MAELDVFQKIFVGMLIIIGLIRIYFGKHRLVTKYKISVHPILERINSYLVSFGMIIFPLLDIYFSCLDKFKFEFPNYIKIVCTFILFVAVIIFYLSHKELADNWSPFLEIKEQQKLIKIGIIGAPNVGKNSLVQSLELIINSNCLEKYIFFEDEKNFCINSVPCAIFDEKEENNFLISKKCKNIKDIKEPKKLLDNFMNIVNKNYLKENYDLEKEPENLDEFISAIKLKYEFENDDLSIRKIIDDIIRGKIKYEIEINDN